MAYFMINNKDFSKYVNALSVTKTANYYAQTNASGNTVVDYINSKRTIEVGFIPMKAEALKELTEAITNFGVSVSFLNPHTNEVATTSCIVADSTIDYYTIQEAKVMANPFTLVFTEL